MKRKKKIIVSAIVVFCLIAVEQVYVFRKLLNAAREGNVVTIRRVLNWHPWVVNWRGKWGFTPLHMATTWEHPEVVKLLLERGGDMHLRCSKGISPLVGARANRLSFDPKWRQGQEGFMRLQGRSEEEITEQLQRIDEAHSPERRERLEQVIAILEAFERSGL